MYPIFNGRILESLTVTPAEAGVQVLALLRRSIDSGLRQNDEYVTDALPVAPGIGLSATTMFEVGIRLK